jgi:hypothetical protein
MAHAKKFELPPPCKQIMMQNDANINYAIQRELLTIKTLIQLPNKERLCVDLQGDGQNDGKLMFRHAFQHDFVADMTGILSMEVGESVRYQKAQPLVWIARFAHMEKKVLKTDRTQPKIDETLESMFTKGMKL